MQPKAALRNGQPAPAQARSGWIMRFVFRTAGPSSQLIWTAVIMHNQNDKPRLEQSPTSHTFLWSAEPAFAALSPRPTLPKTELAGCLCGAPPARQHARPFPLELGFR